MHDKLKSTTRGYGTMDYELLGYRPGDLVRMDILVKGERIDALSIVCDRRDADIRGRAIIKKLKQEIPRHMFEVALQAAIGTPDHRPRDDLGDAQERDRQVLRRRHHPQAQAVGEAEGRQEADEVDRRRSTSRRRRSSRCWRRARKKGRRSSVPVAAQAADATLTRRQSGGGRPPRFFGGPQNDLARDCRAGYASGPVGAGTPVTWARTASSITAGVS